LRFIGRFLHLDHVRSCPALTPEEAGVVTSVVTFGGTLPLMSGRDSSALN
jgi:hypothetical protein